MAIRDLMTPGEVAKCPGVETFAVRELDNWRLSPIATRNGTRYQPDEVGPLHTRSAVARQLENASRPYTPWRGPVLHPSKGPNGVRLFYSREVDRLFNELLEIEQMRRVFAEMCEENARLRYSDAAMVSAIQNRSLNKVT